MIAAIILAALVQCAFGQYLPVNSGCGCGGSSILAPGLIASSQLVQGVGSSALIGAQSLASAYPLAQAADVGVIAARPATVQLINNGYNAAAPVFANNNGGGAGGVGQGQVQLQGEMPVQGVSAVRGSLPVQGLCGFAGNIPAGGIINAYASVPCVC